MSRILYKLCREEKIVICNICNLFACRICEVLTAIVMLLSFGI
jgi:hypothetical protein